MPKTIDDDEQYAEAVDEHDVIRAAQDKLNEVSSMIRDLQYVDNDIARGGIEDAFQMVSHLHDDLDDALNQAEARNIAA